MATNYGQLGRNIKADERALPQNALASENFKRITAADSVLREQADTFGRTYGQSRGLLDSSIAGQAAQGEFIRTAQPLAIEDANANRDQAFRNQDAENTFRRDDKGFYYDVGLQKDQQGFTAGENLKDRGHEFALQSSQHEFESGEANLDRALSKYLQSSDQAWQSTEKSLDRGHDVNLLGISNRFTASESQKDRDWSTGENQKDRDFTSTENQEDRDFRGSEAALDRALTVDENDKDRTFTATESEKDRDLTTSENDLQRAHEKLMQGEQLGHDEKQQLLNRLHEITLQNNDQSWATGENEKDRLLKKFMLGEELTSAEGIALLRANTDILTTSMQITSNEKMQDKDIALQYNLQANDQAFRGKENELDRILTTSENALDRKLAEFLQKDDQTWRSGENNTDRALQERLFMLDQAFQGEENALDRMLQEKLQSSDQSWRTSENEMDRTLSKHLMAYEQKFQGKENQLDRMLQEKIQDSAQDFDLAMQYAQNLYNQGEANKDREFRADEGQKDRDFTSGENEKERDFREDLQDTAISADESSQLREFEQRNVERTEDQINKLATMGYAFELDSALMATTFGANTVTNLTNGINAILADPELTPDAKKAAVQNLFDAGSAQLQWGSTFYNTEMPALTTPTGNYEGILTPGDGATGTTAPEAPGFTYPETPNIDAATVERYSGMVGTAFQNVLGRDPKTEGLNYWINIADEYGLSQAQLEALVRDAAQENGELQ